MKISISIAELPLESSFEDLFTIAKKTKIDGVELFIGPGSRLFFNRVLKLSEKYSIPILTLHQPVWSLARVLKDRKIFQMAKIASAGLVLHPPMNKLLEDPKAQNYFAWFSAKSKEYGVPVYVENMRKKLLGLHRIAYAREFIYPDLLASHVCVPYDMGMTYDTSHSMIKTDIDFTELKEAFPYIKNIHLSDFRGLKEHLTLGEGELPIERFFAFLKEQNYNGIITLELSKKAFYRKHKYHLASEDSIKIIQNHIPL